MKDVHRDTPVYPIGVVRRLTDLTDRQIRYYEHVGLFRPARSLGKRRLFSQADVEILLRIKHEMERGLRTSEIRELLGIGREGREPVLSLARQHLPHFAAGESAGAADPDVETRRTFMTRLNPKRGG